MTETPATYIDYPDRHAMARGVLRRIEEPGLIALIQLLATEPGVESLRVETEYALEDVRRKRLKP